ncbi:hypothetical protein ACJX0J_020695, partial [Zea mays]
RSDVSERSFSLSVSPLLFTKKTNLVHFLFKKTWKIIVKGLMNSTIFNDILSFLVESLWDFIPNLLITNFLKNSNFYMLAGFAMHVENLDPFKEDKKVSSLYDWHTHLVLEDGTQIVDGKVQGLKGFQVCKKFGVFKDQLYTLIANIMHTLLMIALIWGELQHLLAYGMFMFM